MKKWLPFLLFFFFNLSTTSLAGDQITMETSLSEEQTLISAGGNFELGFFIPDNSRDKFLGIWYKKIPQTVVWVANRGSPLLKNHAAALKIGKDGSLILQDDIGNDSESIIWQSFDHPFDTLLPGMKLGWNLKTNLSRYLTTWKSSDDPSEGDYTFKLDLQGSPEFYIWHQSQKYYRNGPWIGYEFSGEPEMQDSKAFSFDFVSTEDEIYYTYKILDSSLISRFLLNGSVIQRYVWIASKSSWSPYWSLPRDPCDFYGECGPYGYCDVNELPICNCLKGFEPKSPQEWSLRDASSGCVRRTPLQCQDRDGFLKMSGVKLPDTSHATVDESIDLEACQRRCLSNCSCTAYSNANFRSGRSGCITWQGDLIDIRMFVDNGQDLYIRLAASELGNSKKKRGIAIIVVIVVSAVLLLGFVVYCILKKNYKRKGYMQSRQLQLSNSFNIGTLSENDNSREIELPLFDLSTIGLATDNFSNANKLGEGGFGSVYKGKLGGQLIAAKRLSKTSQQGLEEFKNEVMLIVKLQHVNLVRLLGCCIQGEERMLIYEYMENRSLDTIIFDNTKSKLLSWQKRLNIISGIARGLLYLHQDSRFRIIHRDLKASNILLDEDMNPKISDFGLARTFGGDGQDERTKRLVGTHGYMAPEYAMDGIFSTKSDVFSFGVLVLEIISGKKNKGFFYTDPQQNLLHYTWSLWKEGNGLELLDESISNTPDAHLEALRCIQVGLLCVQERAEDRPEMSLVLVMLGAQSGLPQPKSPGFSARKSENIDAESSASFTVNDITVTMIDGR